MPFLIPVCPSPTHPHAHTTYVAERNSNQGKDRERGKDLPAWVSVSLHGRVCVCGDMCVYLRSHYIGDASLDVKGIWMLGWGGEEFGDEPCVPHLGLGWAQI